MGVAAFITAINISIYCIWVPSRLQISPVYEQINTVWDRIEKCLYLIVDAALNFLFIRMFSSRLVDLGLSKYDSLLAFNKKIIFVSLAMDVMIIGLMSLPSSFVYMQFHPVAYIVKLEIEMAMSSIMIKVASASTGIENYQNDTEADSRWTSEQPHQRCTGPVVVHVVNHVTETVEVDENYPNHLRNGAGNRKMNRISSSTFREIEDQKDHEDDLEKESYPQALARYPGFFPDQRVSTSGPPSPSSGDAPAYDLEDMSSPLTVTRVQVEDPFQGSVDSLNTTGAGNGRGDERGGVDGLA